MKKTFIIFGLFIVGLVAAALVLPSFVDWNTYRDRLASHASDALGRTVSVGGDLEFRILPYPTFSVADVSISNDRDGEHTDMLTLRDMDVRMSLMPLLRGRFVVDRIILVEPILALERMPEGRFNWTVLSTGPGMRDAISLGRVTIENGTLHWRDHIDGAGGTVDSIFGQISAESLNGPYTALGSLDIGDFSFALDGRMGRIGSGGTSSIDATIGLDGASIETTLRGLAYWNQPRVELDTTMQGVSFATLIHRLSDGQGVELAPDRPFSLTGRLTGSPDGAQLQDGLLTIDDTRLRGSVAYDTAIDPRIDITMTTSRLDLDALGIGQDPAQLGRLLARLADGLALAKHASAEHTDPAPERQSGRNATMITFDLSAEAVTYRNALIRQFRFDAVAADGVLAINSLRTDLPGTTDLSVVGTLRREDGAAYADLGIDGRSSDLRRLFGWLGADTGQLPSDRLRRVAGSMTIRGWQHDFSLTDIDVTLDTSTVRGEIAATTPRLDQEQGQGQDAARRAFSVDLVVDRIDLDAYGLPSLIAETFQDQVGIDWTTDIARQAFEKLAPWVEMAEIDLIFAAETLVAGGYEMSGVDIDASTAQGRMTVRRAIIDAIGNGSVALSGSIDRLQPLTGLDVLFNVEVEEPGPFWIDAADRVFGLTPASARRIATDGVLAGHVRGDSAAVEIALDTRLAEISTSIRGLISAPLTFDIAEGSTSASYDLSVRADHRDFRSLLALLGRSDVAGRISSDQEFVLYADLSGTPVDIDIDNFSADLAGLVINGQGGVSIDAGMGPDINISLETSDVDADIYLPLIADLARFAITGETRAEGWGAQADIALESSRWTSRSLDLSVTAPSIRLALGRDGVAIESLTGSAFGGTLSLSGSTRSPTWSGHDGDENSNGNAMDSSGTNRVRLDAALNDVSVSEALRPMVGANGILGDATIDLSIEGTLGNGLFGRQVPDAGDFSGTAAIRWRNGSIRGLDIAEIDAALADQVGPVAFLDRLQGATERGTTEIDDTTVSLALSNGVVSLDDIELATPTATATARGTLDLPRWHLDMTTDFVFVNRPGAPPLSMRLAGSPSSPARQWQTGALQAFVAQQAADAIGNSPTQ